MKHNMFILVWLALLVSCFTIVGILALLGYANAEVIFWNSSPIESKMGKIAWIVVSATFLILFLRLIVRGSRRKNDRSPT